MERGGGGGSSLFLSLVPATRKHFLLRSLTRLLLLLLSSPPPRLLRFSFFFFRVSTFRSESFRNACIHAAPSLPPPLSPNIFRSPFREAVSIIAGRKSSSKVSSPQFFLRKPPPPTCSSFHSISLAALPFPDIDTNTRKDTRPCGNNGPLIFRTHIRGYRVGEDIVVSRGVAASDLIDTNGSLRPRRKGGGEKEEMEERKVGIREGEEKVRKTSWRGVETESKVGQNLYEIIHGES